MRGAVSGWMMAFGLSLWGQEVSRRPVTPQQALQAARQAWAAEGGRTWGHSLAGPLLVVDPVTRKVWASEADGEGRLKRDHGCFTGLYPPGATLANTAISWANKRWSMVLLPLPKDHQDLKALLLHESWHRLQPTLGLDLPEGNAGHLDTLDGRYWLQLEWRALARALTSRGAAKRQWIQASLGCRAQRRALFPEGAEAERMQELTEGLAEYTGVRGAGTRAKAVRKLRFRKGPHARTFAYASGPAYGLLLDEAAPGWSRKVDASTDLGQLLQKAEGLPPPQRADSDPAVAHLGGAELLAAETRQEEARTAHLAGIRARFAEGPTLRLPGPFQLQFNPGDTESIEGLGIHHLTATVQGAWGTLVVSRGCIRAEDWSEIRVAAPVDAAQRPLSGPGWTLDVAPGWSLRPSDPKSNPGEVQLFQEARP